MKIIIFYFWAALILAGCSNEKIDITYDYIVNPNWNDKANSISINELKLKKDSIINPYTDLSQVELLEKLEDDTSFLFVANVKYDGKGYSDRKVYFDKNNGFSWWSNKGEFRTERIGNLKKNSWYKFSHLVTYPYYVYVFVDSVNKVHRFDVNLANY